MFCFFFTEKRWTKPYETNAWCLETQQHRFTQKLWPFGESAAVAKFWRSEGWECKITAKIGESQNEICRVHNASKACAAQNWSGNTATTCLSKVRDKQTDKKKKET